jgi:hypothetical protein
MLKLAASAASFGRAQHWKWASEWRANVESEGKSKGPSIVGHLEYKKKKSVFGKYCEAL